MSSHAVAITGYCVLIGALIILTVIARKAGGRVISGSGLMAAIRRSRTGRILLALAWAWVGWHVFVR